MNFKQRNRFLKMLKKKEKVFSLLILHSRCMKYKSKKYIHFISCKAISITFETDSLDLPSTNNN